MLKYPQTWKFECTTGHILQTSLNLRPQNSITCEKHLHVCLHAYLPAGSLIMTCGHRILPPAYSPLSQTWTTFLLQNALWMMKYIRTEQKTVKKSSEWSFQELPQVQWMSDLHLLQCASKEWQRLMCWWRMLKAQIWTCVRCEVGWRHAQCKYFPTSVTSAAGQVIPWTVPELCTIDWFMGYEHDVLYFWLHKVTMQTDCRNESLQKAKWMS